MNIETNYSKFIIQYLQHLRVHTLKHLEYSIILIDVKVINSVS